jgi:hypothetical protein
MMLRASSSVYLRSSLMNAASVPRPRREVEARQLPRATGMSREPVRYGSQGAQKLRPSARGVSSTRSFRSASTVGQFVKRVSCAWRGEARGRRWRAGERRIALAALDDVAELVTQGGRIHAAQLLEVLLRSGPVSPFHCAAEAIPSVGPSSGRQRGERGVAASPAWNRIRLPTHGGRALRLPF